MAKTITFEFGGMDYELEFTIRTVKEMEKGGFSLERSTDMPVSAIESLFAGSFLAHHRREKAETIKAIWNAMPDKDRLVEKLVVMYNDPINSMMDDPEDETKKVKWVSDFE